ncbi:MAG: hypothetical protein NVSMB62_26310 [Acidobacteriaceae bacterium]
MNFRVGMVSLLLSVLSPVRSLPAQSSAPSNPTGVWQGFATVRGGEHVPITVRITESGSELHLALLNGPAAHPEESRASAVTLNGPHLLAVYDYIARKLDGTISGDTLTGTYGPVDPNATHGVTVKVEAKRVPKPADPPSAPDPPDIQGAWEIATTASKGPETWEFRVDPPLPGTPVRKSVIQRIDGDTGALWGVWNGSSFRLGHFAASGAALYSVTPLPDGTLRLKNLIEPTPPKPRPGERISPVAPLPDYIARRPQDARAHNLAAPTDPARATSVKDPSVPFAFRFPDLSGRIISNTDAQFRGKVVIVAIGGSWCPNCHDEAPFLVDLYRKYHAKGLEIVGLDFEQGDPAMDAARLRAFIKHYGIPYPMLAAGTTDELNEKIPQGVNLNSWPTSFFLGRDGLVKEVHSGFAGPGNTAGHMALERNVTALIEKLLQEPPPSGKNSVNGKTS